MGVGVALGLGTAALIGVFGATKAKGVMVARSIVGEGGTSVGGIDVAVGIAAFVKAIWVMMMGTAVFCMSVTLKVGCDVPQADSPAINNIEITDSMLLFICTPRGDIFTTDWWSSNATGVYRGHQNTYEFRTFKIYSAVRLPDVPSVNVISSSTNFRLWAASRAGFVK